MTRKIALITGAGSGIGRACALGLMKAGYDAVLTGRRKDKLEETARLGTSSGARSLAIQADLTDPAQVAALFAKVTDSFGRLDLLFNNAGVSPPGNNFENLAVEQWKAAFDTNVTAPFLCSQHAFRIMKDQTPRGGRIINNGSISAQSPRPFSAPYTATKHAVTGLTKAMALEGRAYDIACSQIDIGNAATDMTQRMAEGILQANGERLVEPRIDLQAVVDAVVYMANLPPEANVLFMTLMATKMPFVGRG